MGTLFVVATPIGNLGDITVRGLETLKKVDLILAEDTRVAKKLLTFYEIKVPLQSYHQHSDDRKEKYILDLLKKGKKLALVTDSGTPGISDPGNKLIKFLSSASADLEIIPMPGPSALTALASVSGLPMDKFIFLGFPPHKKGRQKFFKEVAEAKHSVIIYESPHRILKTLKELDGRQVVVGRELTKKFETIYRGKAEELIREIKSKGEFVIAIRKNLR